MFGPFCGFSGAFLGCCGICSGFCFCGFSGVSAASPGVCLLRLVCNSSGGVYGLLGVCSGPVVSSIMCSAFRALCRVLWASAGFSPGLLRGRSMRPVLLSMALCEIAVRGSWAGCVALCCCSWCQVFRASEAVWPCIWLLKARRFAVVLCTMQH